MFHRQYHGIFFFLLIASTAGCGGGGGGSTTASSPAAGSSQQMPPAPAITRQAADSTMTMSCVDGPAYQCSGETIIQYDNGVALTRSGVQVYGRSTNDLVSPIAEVTKATGLAPASGGTAEVRLVKDGNAAVSAPALLLSKFGLTWDYRTERPSIIETFNPSRGRVQLGANGALTAAPLPESFDLGFYDFATKGTAATQANYANNRYFPRSSNPSRCATPPCREIETSGLQVRTGDWRTGGNSPDFATASRFHEDGDIHAGNGNPDSNGNVTLLRGASGIGVPFPGSKGGRDFNNWSFRYVNLTAWLSQDTVEINDWVGGGRFNEHNTNRRGIVAFGDVSLPTAVPASGTANYSGLAYGWYVSNANDNAVFFRGAATATVNFATRATIITLVDTIAEGANAIPVPVTFTAAAVMGTNGEANYLTGPASNATLSGGLGGRYFGPVVATGTSGAGPAELGGAFSLTNAASGATAIGGFIARKR